MSFLNVPPNDNFVCDRCLRQPEVLILTGVSWATLRRWERQGRFPKRHKIGPRAIAWKESEIQRWIATGGKTWVNNEEGM